MPSSGIPACVVDCRIQIAELLFDRCKHGFQFVHLRKVRTVCDCVRPEPFYFVQQGLRFLRIRTVMQEEFRPGAGEGKGYAPADSFPRAGDQDFFAFHFLNSGSIMR